jgi:hypothetical protein
MLLLTVFFPLMKTPDLEGFLDLLYESPNNWENRIRKTIFMHLIWSENSYWKTRQIAVMKKGDVFRLNTKDLDTSIMRNHLALAYPAISPLPEKMSFLPTKKTWYSEVPAWRNTSGFYNSFAQVSYQSDLEPLPSKASLMTFHPFIQFSKIQNRLVLLNATHSPALIESKVQIYNSNDMVLIAEEKVTTNSTTTIYLDKYGFSPTDLPIFFCPNMAGIPFGLGISNDSKMLSMEHTHPPASLVLHGDRRAIQGKIKNNWIIRMKSNVQQ